MTQMPPYGLRAYRIALAQALLFAASSTLAQQTGVTLADIPRPGTFDAQAEAMDQTRTVCTFNLQGDSSAAGALTGGVVAASIAPTIQAADISCHGGAGSLTIWGGPALAPFAPAFVGVNYIEQIAQPGASMVIKQADFSIEDSTFSGLAARGLAVLSFVESKVAFRNVTFLEGSNSAAGAIYANESSDVTILDSVFMNNVGGQGGAVSTWNSTVLVNGSSFSGNIGDGQGGALSIHNATTVVLLDSTFTENSANNGGGVYVEDCGSSVYYGNNFTSNAASHSGGGLFLIKCSGELSSNIFETNKGANGGAVWQNDCEKVTHQENQFLSNLGTDGSGGLEMNQGAGAISLCTFIKNKGTKGAGIYMQDIQASIADCTFEGNAVTQFGGAIFRGTGTGDISGCDFTGNRAKKSGAAIYDSHETGDIGGNSFSENKATRDGSIIFRTESQGTVKNDNVGLPLTANAVHEDNSTGDETGDATDTGDASAASGDSDTDTGEGGTDGF